MARRGVSLFPTPSTQTRPWYAGGFFLVMIEIIILIVVLLLLIGIGVFLRRAIFK